MKPLFLFFLIYFGFSFQNIAAVSGSDNVVIHLDKSFYVSGENIWYSIYFPDFFKTQTAAIQVVIYDRSGNRVFNTFHKLDHATQLNGYIPVSFNWKADNFRLVVMGRDSKQQKLFTLADKIIPIYEDKEKSLNSTEIANIDATTANNLASFTGNLKVEVAPTQPTFKTTEQVSVRVEVRDAQNHPVKAQMSISVTEMGLTTETAPSFETISCGVPIPSQLDLDSSIIIQGSVLNNASQPLNTRTLGVYIRGLNEIFYPTMIGDGKFELRLPNLYGEQTLQFIDYLNRDIHIKWEEISLAPLPPLVYTPEVVAYIESSRKRKKIYQLFGGIESSIEPEVPAPERSNPSPDEIIRINDYEPFPSVPDFFQEIITPLKIRKENPSTYSIRLFNHDYKVRGLYPLSPLFILNGRATRDEALVAGLEIKFIDRFELYYDNLRLEEFFGVVGKSGVVNIFTTEKPPIFSAPETRTIFSFQGYQPSVTFPLTESIPNDEKSAVPTFRSQLYWNPNLTTDDQGIGTCSFPSSSDITGYQIKVVVQSKNGEMGYGTGAYRTVW